MKDNGPVHIGEVLTQMEERRRRAAELRDKPVLTLEEMRIVDRRIDVFIARTESFLNRLGRDYDWEDVWCGYRDHFGLKPIVCMLAGWERSTGPENLRSSDAYDVLYQHVLEMVQGGTDQS